MKKLRTKVLLALVLSGVLLAGCGSSSYEKAGASNYYDGYASEAMTEAAPGNYYGATDDVYDYAMEEEAMADSSDMKEAPGAATGEATEADILTDSATDLSTRKLIKNVNLSVETEEFDKFLVNIENKVLSLGGYVESSEISGRSYYNSESHRYASITARVPNDKLDSFINSVSQQSNITNKSQSAEDVTLQYTDTKAHIDTLKVEQERLNELVKQAEDLETILTLEARLTEVSYQIESYERQLRSMDNKVDYSTVYLYIDEVTHYTPPAEPEPKTVGERIATGLGESLYDIGHGFQEIGIDFLINLPYIILTLLIIGIIGLIVLLIVKRAIKSSEKSKQKRIQKEYERRKANSEAATTTQAAPSQPEENKEQKK